MRNSTGLVLISRTHRQAVEVHEGHLRIMRNSTFNAGIAPFYSLGQNTLEIRVVVPRFV